MRIKPFLFILALASTSLSDCSLAGGPPQFSQAIAYNVGPPSTGLSTSIGISAHSPKPGFFLFDGVSAYEFSETAVGRRGYIGAVPFGSIPFGVDSKGNMFAIAPPNGICPVPLCKINVYSSSGEILRSVSLPQMTALFVDRAGSIYGTTPDCKIEQFAPNVTGTPTPERVLNMKPSFCEKPAQLISSFNGYRLFADSKGTIYFLSSPGKSYKKQVVLVWPPGAHASARPTRAIYTTVLINGVEAVTSSGGIWSSNGPLYYFASKANGSSQPQKSIDAADGGFIYSVTTLYNGNVVDLVEYPSKKCALEVRSVAGTVVQRTITLLHYQCNVARVLTSF